MQLHELKRQTKNKTAKRVGRGGKRGKTSGRGHKGQKSRAGGSPRPAMRDIIKQLPKRRGYGKNRPKTINSATTKPFAINLRDLEKSYKAGENVTPVSLAEKGLVKRVRGRVPEIKILSTGELNKKLTLSGVLLSEAAREKLKKSGSIVK